jgi:hypothetical protein
MAASTNFPNLSRKASTKGFKVKYEDPAMRAKTEGGYVITRARHTRLPRKTFSVRYEDISEADRLLLQTLWNTVRGGSATFNWQSPQDGITYEVRFTSEIILEYHGFGETQRWDCSFDIEQA